MAGGPQAAQRSAGGAAALVAALLAWLAAPAGSAGPLERQELHYRWHLGNFLGVVAGLFFPDAGDGILTVEPLADGTVKSELVITSPEGRDGDYFRYGSVVDPTSAQTLRAWSSYSWRGEQRSKSGDVGAYGVMDVASGILLLRIDPPDRPRTMEIWSEGKLYPVVVIPLARETRSLGGRRVATRHLAVRGVEQAGKRFWKGRMDLWLAEDEAATPVEIRLERKRLGLHLELKPR
jgi:hypothetical protein